MCTVCVFVQVSYVLETEDLMVRKRRRVGGVGPVVGQRRVTRFAAWLASQNSGAADKQGGGDGAAADMEAAAVLAGGV
jgi:hypothetical protein